MTDGKLTDKPSDTLRKKLNRRAKEQTRLVQEMNSSDKVTTYGVMKKPSPSERRSASFKKKLRNRDGFKIKDDFKEPEPIKGV